jgi:recombination protein RecA
MSIYDDLVKKYKDSVSMGKNRVFDGLAIPTGVISIDNAIGVGGVPTRKVTQIYGQESAGKSTIALQTVSFAQKMGMDVVYIDAEASIDAEYASMLGVDFDNLIIINPETSEDVMDIVRMSIGSAGLIVIDSVPALPTRYEEGGEIGDAHVGQLAKLMSQSSRIWTPVLANSNTAILAINQIRARISQYSEGGKPIPGGHQWKHRIDVQVYLKITKNSDALRTVKFKIEKNKVGIPLTEGSFDILHGKGVSLPSQLLQLGQEQGILKKAGSWIKYEDESLGQGYGAIDGLLERGDVVEQILKGACRSERQFETYNAIFNN